MLSEDDRVIETCRSVLNVLMNFRLLKLYIYIYISRRNNQILYLT